MIVRVGLPHRGGKLAFHAFNHCYPAMVSTNAFWNGKAFSLPDASDVQELDFALDSAGFTAMKLWQTKGPQPGIGGIYPWSYAAYIEFALSSGATWWSQPDLCCEPQIARNQDEVDFRVNATATFLEGTMRIVNQWSFDAGFRWSSPLPIIQGWSVSDYLRSLDLMLQVWERWHSAPPTLIGIGSVCRRSLHDPAHGLLPILSALEVHLPPRSSLHLFGVKGSALSVLKMHEFVASVDSMAYDFSARVSARLHSRSNDMAHRSAEMTHWMSAAQHRLEASIGDQFRLFGRREASHSQATS